MKLFEYGEIIINLDKINWIESRTTAWGTREVEVGFAGDGLVLNEEKGSALLQSYRAERANSANVYVKDSASVWVGLMGDWPTVTIDSLVDTDDCEGLVVGSVELTFESFEAIDHLIADLTAGLERVRGEHDG